MLFGSVHTRSINEASTRPPTPPKVSLRPSEQQVIQFRHSFGNLTPPESSPLSSRNDSPTKARKRVNFCQWSSDPRTALDHCSQNYIKSSPVTHAPSLALRKPLRSILKNSRPFLDPQTPLSDGPSPALSDLGTGYFDVTNVAALTVADMIDSVLKLLANASPMYVRLDGYQTLNGAFKTYSNLPEEAIFKASLPQLAQYIARDVINTPRDASGMNLITQALKLSITLIHTPALATSLGTDIQLVLLENALDILAQPVVVKAIANHFFYVLASQDFGSRVLTPLKIKTLLEHLNTMHERISGNSAVASRLAIYSRFMQQAPAVMLAEIKLWLPHIFHGVLSTHKDVRTRAIDCGMAVGLALGKNQTTTKALIDLFASETAQGGTYGEYLTTRLSAMFDDKTQRHAVARIWGMVVVLFTQTRKRSITDWPMFRSFLFIIQRCMNAGDIETKFEAMQAWNRLVYTSALDRVSTDPNDKLTTLLKAPFVHAFGKALPNAAAREAQRISLHSYCNLLYYALQPSQSHERLDAMWTMYVKPILSTMLSAGGREAKFAVKITKSILHGPTSTWDLHRATAETPIAPTDLARLDPAWIRSRLPNILEILEPFFSVCLWLESDAYSVAATPWPELISALANAARHEVRQSIETKHAIAHLVNFFRRLWLQAHEKQEQPQDGDVWIRHYCALLDYAINALGPDKFSEPNMTEESSMTIGPTITPSHRMSKHHAPARAPLVYLVQLFFKRPSAVRSSLIYQESATNLMRTVCRALPSHKSRFALIRACIPKCTDSENTSEHGITEAIIEALVKTALDDDAGLQQRFDISECMQHVMMTLDDIFDTCTSIGIPAPGPINVATMKCLEAIGLLLQDRNGALSIESDLVMPIIGCIWNCYDRQERCLPAITVVSYVAFALSHFPWPNPDLPSDESDDDPLRWLEPVFELASASCKLIGKPETEALRPQFISALRHWIVRCPSALTGRMLRQIQTGLAELIQSVGRDQMTETLEDEDEIYELWNIVLDKLACTHFEDILLRTFSILFVGAFCSHNRKIVESTIGVWNVMLRSSEPLTYPEDLQNLLQRLRHRVKLELPGFPSDVDEADSPCIPYLGAFEHYTEAAGEGEQINDGLAQNSDEMDVDDPLTNIQTKTAETMQPFLDGAVDDSTAAIAKRKRKTEESSEWRPRHDDSQVHFCDVQSSPLPVSEDESQHLTDHQIEVASRQQQELSRLYPELSSSPIPNFAKRSSRRFLKQGEQSMEETDLSKNEMTERNGEDESLTPRERRVRARRRICDVQESLERAHEVSTQEVGDGVQRESSDEIDMDARVNESRAVAGEDGEKEQRVATPGPTTTAEEDAMQSNNVDLGEQHVDGDDAARCAGQAASALEDRMDVYNVDVVATPTSKKRKRAEQDEGPEEEPSRVSTRSNNKKAKLKSPVKQFLDRLWGVGRDKEASQEDDDKEEEEEEDQAESQAATSQPVSRVTRATSTPQKDTKSASQPTISSAGRRTMSNRRRSMAIMPRSDSHEQQTGSPHLRRSRRVANSQHTDDDDDHVANSNNGGTGAVAESNVAVATPTKKTRPRRGQSAVDDTANATETIRPRRSTRRSVAQGEETSYMQHTPKVMEAVVIPASFESQEPENEAESAEIMAEVQQEADTSDEQDQTLYNDETTIRAKNQAADDVEMSEADTDKDEAAMTDEDNDDDVDNKQDQSETTEQAESQGSQVAMIGRNLFGKLRDVWNDFSRIALGFQEAQEYDDMLQDIRKEVIEAEKRGRQAKMSLRNE